MAVYVVWHPEFELGQTIADRVYSHLCRDIHHATSRGIGIPVFFRSAARSGGDPLPLDVPLDGAGNTAVVVLVDDHMVAGDGWDSYVEAIWHDTTQADAPHRVFPVQLSEHAFNFSGALAECNFLRLKAGGDARIEELLIRLTHELCRQLLGETRVADASPADSTAASPQPVALFLSHAKRDGEHAAKLIRNYVESTLPLKTFFDALDIAPGFSFKNEIDAGIERAALLVVQTDAYSSREWCQHEIMWAKRRQRPVVVAHAVAHGERRSFPYAGNVPTRRWSAARLGDCERLIGEVLREILRFEHFRRHVDALGALFEFPPDTRVMPSPPELLTLLHVRSETPPPSAIVYPDPPLGVEELQVLRMAAPDMVFTTPTLLATRSP